jgi:hypothetical protein
MKGPICASGSRGFFLKTLENKCRDRAHRNLQISDGRAALHRNASQGISAQETSARADGVNGAACTITSPTVANRREKTKLV